MLSAPLVVATTLSAAALVLAAAVDGGRAPAAAAASTAPHVLSQLAPAATGSSAGRAAPMNDALTAADTAAVPGMAAAVPADSRSLALTDDQHLIADQALHAVMDAYLADRRNPQRLQQLAGFVRARLPAGAASEALALAARYDAYLTAHDALLKAQNFGDQPDLYRLAGWQAQRRQLRQRMLGADVSEQWFGTDDAYLEQAIAERRHPPASTAQRPASDDERLHALHMQAVIDAALGRAAP
ncbi:hypothetical protein ASF61_06275 [Duganella sp. Leaf126]|uniref:lipase secretion chaperone n=1 Tax=Duganella sp. Leaf126 TaxID=1736266 RepID=UPI0006F67E5B|nr:lipase secretion chaperone [Duganella sp. Leaf126]KQQ40368.1 hypothetical protein ASF61_06275 [Duganella sp. Leaf126]